MKKSTFQFLFVVFFSAAVIGGCGIDLPCLHTLLT